MCGPQVVGNQLLHHACTGHAGAAAASVNVQVVRRPAVRDCLWGSAKAARRRVASACVARAYAYVARRLARPQRLLVSLMGTKIGAVRARASSSRPACAGLEHDRESSVSERAEGPTAHADSPAHPPEASPTRPEDILQGTITRLRVDQSGKAVSLYGALKPTSGETISFYMRGREVRGIVEVGDRVRLEAVSLTERDGLRATHLDNLTTNSRVSVWEPPFYRRLAAWGGPFLMSAIIGPILGGLVAAAIGIRGAGSSHLRPVSNGPSAAVVLLFVGVTLIVALAVFYRLYTRPRRKRRAALVAAARSHNGVGG